MGTYKTVLFNTLTNLIEVAPIASTDYLGQTASVGPIVLTTPVDNGVYRVSVYEECTVAGAAAGGSPYGTGLYGSGVYNPANDTLQTTIYWTDEAGTRFTTPIITPLDLSDTNASSGSTVVRSVSGQPISFSSTLVKTGSPTYGVSVRIERL
jgi:hypothetical protein